MSITEYKLQQICFLWFWNDFPEYRLTMFHIPNGGKRDPITAARMKSIGVIAGIPDMCWIFDGNVVFFEFKKPGVGVVSENQTRVHIALKQQKANIYIVESFEHFQSIVKKYLYAENN